MKVRRGKREAWSLAVMLAVAALGLTTLPQVLAQGQAPQGRGGHYERYGSDWKRWHCPGGCERRTASRGTLAIVTASRRGQAIGAGLSVAGG